jgi:hypothetical protein
MSRVISYSWLRKVLPLLSLVLILVQQAVAGWQPHGCDDGFSTKHPVHLVHKIVHSNAGGTHPELRINQTGRLDAWRGFGAWSGLYLENGWQVGFAQTVGYAFEWQRLTGRQVCILYQSLLL